MSALPLVPTLSLLPTLTPAAAKALDVTPAEIVRRWLAGLSEGARRAYARSLARFARWLLAGDAEPERALQALCVMSCGHACECLRTWRDELLEGGLSSGTVGGYVTAIASLLGACRRAGLITWSVEGVAPRYERRHDRSGPRRGEVERLFAVVDEAAEAGEAQAVRDAALLRLLYCGALRRSEAVGLRIEDVDLDGQEGPVVRPRRKGHRERAPVTISAGTAAALVRWLAVRGTEPGPLFRRVRAVDPDVALSGDAVRRTLRSWAQRAGIRATIRPHGLRHSSATEIAKRGSLAQLMALGGWASFSAAERYLDRRTEERQTALALVDL